jgi:hypothetical protein
MRRPTQRHPPEMAQELTTTTRLHSSCPKLLPACQQPHHQPHHGPHPSSKLPSGREWCSHHGGLRHAPHASCPAHCPVQPGAAALHAVHHPAAPPHLPAPFDAWRLLPLPPALPPHVPAPSSPPQTTQLNSNRQRTYTRREIMPSGSYGTYHNAPSPLIPTSFHELHAPRSTRTRGCTPHQWGATPTTQQKSQGHHPGPPSNPQTRPGMSEERLSW